MFHVEQLEVVNATSIFYYIGGNGMYQMDWILIIPLILFITFSLGYIVADKKHTGESWIEIFFD